MNTYGGNESVPVHILNQSTRWRSMVSVTKRPLYPLGKRTRDPFDRRLCGPQSQFGRGGERKNSLPLPGIETQSLYKLTLLRFYTLMI